MSKYETTVEKFERAIVQLQKCGYPRTKAIDRLIYELEQKDEWLANYARANLLK